MARVNWLIVLSLLALALTGCDTAVSQAKAERIRAQASVIEARAEATRAATEYAAARHADALAVLEATQPTRAAAKSNIIWWGSVMAIAVLVSFGIVAVGSFGYISAGYARATVATATLRSQMIHIDAGTRTWPVLITPGGRLVDLETGETRLLSDAKPVDYRRLAISARIREAGLYADAMRDVAKTTRDAQPGDMIPGIAANIPMINMEEDRFDKKM